MVDCDIRAFFDNVSRSWLVRFLEHRIGDKRVIRLIIKWLNAGVMEAGEWRDDLRGTPQGSVASPILANIYLHYVLDLWFQKKWRSHEVEAHRYLHRFVLRYTEGERTGRRRSGGWKYPSRTAGHGDKRVIRLIIKWLNAGVMEAGEWRDDLRGTPQGSVASPILANIYLHYVLDLWFQKKWRSHEVEAHRYLHRFVLRYTEGERTGRRRSGGWKYPSRTAGHDRSGSRRWRTRSSRRRLWM